jgi:hypothetical protein
MKKAVNRVGSIGVRRSHRWIPHVRRYTMRFVAALIVATMVGTGGAQGAFAPVTPAAFASAVTQEAPSFVVADRDVGIEPSVQLVELLFQCTQPFGQAVGELLYVHGFSIVDARDYRLNGPMALQDAFVEAELNAQGAAAAMLEGVSLYARNARERASGTTAAGTVTGDAAVGELTSTFSSTAFRNVSQESFAETRAYLRGGRAIGVRVVSLGDQGFCVVMRYGIPLDQEGFNPATMNTPVPAPPQPVPPSGGDGFPFPPPGSIGSF